MCPVIMAEPKSTQRNPPWSRDELILALDFYLRHHNHIPSKTSAEIEELSLLLNDMARQTGEGHGGSMRAPLFLRLSNPPRRLRVQAV